MNITSHELPYQFEREAVAWDTLSARYKVSAQVVYSGQEGLGRMATESLSRLMAHNLVEVMSIKLMTEPNGDRIYESSIMLARSAENHESSHRRRARQDLNLITDLGQKIRGINRSFPPNSPRQEQAYRDAVKDVMRVLETKENEFHQIIESVN